VKKVKNLLDDAVVACKNNYGC